MHKDIYLREVSVIEWLPFFHTFLLFTHAYHFFIDAFNSHYIIVKFLRGTVKVGHFIGGAIAFATEVVLAAARESL